MRFILGVLEGKQVEESSTPPLYEPAMAEYEDFYVSDLNSVIID